MERVRRLQKPRQAQQRPRLHRTVKLPTTEAAKEAVTAEAPKAEVPKAEAEEVGNLRALEEYRSKRDFDKSTEPKGGSGSSRTKPAGQGLFVIQKHAARRLHYDLRLELNGVLKSWAVTKGPSLNPQDKRLAVQVEDHPLEYASFEGRIPQGSYGAGTVVLWDRGRWNPHGDAVAGLTKGHLEFYLAGVKLKGRWHLVRMAPRGTDTKVNWLLIKAKDKEARPGGAPDILTEQPNSVKDLT